MSEWRTHPARTAPRMALAIVLTALLALPAAATPLRDPTQPPAAHRPATKKAARKAPRWVLSSTLVSGQRRTAVINDRVVGVGERINGARVVEIQPAKVRLRRQGRDITLVLLKQNIKRPSHHGSGRP